MKKLFALILFILSLTGASAYAEAPFGELTYKADDGLYLFSDGGIGAYDSFGFAFSDGVKTIHIYQMGCDFDKPYCAVLKSFPEKELEVRQFICVEEEFLYDLPVYITLKNNQLTAKTLEQKKAEEFLNLKAAVDISLYREAEQLSIEKILLDAQGKINALNTAYEIEDALNRALEKISQIKTDEELYAEELAALKAEEISAVSGLIDKTLYREAEQQIIEQIISEAEESINSAGDKETVLAVASEAKTELGNILTDEKCKENTLLNDEVLYYLGEAYDKLEGFRSRYNTGKLILNRILPVIKIVLNDGSYGRIYITPEYINGAYEIDVSYVKQKYGEMTDTEKTGFKNEIYDRVQNEIALEFLREYFGL